MKNKTHILPKIIAHRGAVINAPENTLTSFRTAAKMGAKWIEFDVQLTGDEEVVVYHDATLLRLMSLPYRVSCCALSELKSYPFREKLFNHSRESIPTLDETLSLAALLGIGVNIELKQTKHNCLLVDRTISCRQKTWRQDLPKPLISSFQVASLKYLSGAYTDYPFALNLSVWPDELPEIIYQRKCVSVHLSKKIASVKRVAFLQSLNKRVCVFTVNDKLKARALFEMGVAGIFTDNTCLYSLDQI